MDVNPNLSAADQAAIRRKIEADQAAFSNFSIGPGLLLKLGVLVCVVGGGIAILNNSHSNPSASPSQRGQPQPTAPIAAVPEPTNNSPPSPAPAVPSASPSTSSPPIDDNSGQTDQQKIDDLAQAVDGLDLKHIVVASKILNVRECPDASCKAIGQLVQGNRADVLDNAVIDSKTGVFWVQIRGGNGVTGYVNGKSEYITYPHL